MISKTFSLTLEMISNNTSMEKFESMTVRELEEFDRAVVGYVRQLEKHKVNLYAFDLAKYLENKPQKETKDESGYETDDTNKTIEFEYSDPQPKHKKFAAERNLTIDTDASAFEMDPRPPMAPTNVIPKRPMESDLKRSQPMWFHKQRKVHNGFPLKRTHVVVQTAGTML